MQTIGRHHSCLPGYLFIFWILVLPGSIRACPKACACYVKTEVHCTFRYLSVIPKQIQVDVERINLGYNSISMLTEADFSGLQKLELLMLHSNEIQTIHENAFSELSSLQVLKMSYNKVKKLHRNTFRGLKSLVRLHMDHNKLEFLAPESFYGLTSLKLVHLEGNVLRQLHTDTFVTLHYIQIFKASSIKHIYLSDNQLTTLPKEMFLYLNELEGLYLHGNPWSCDCNLLWLAEWGQQSKDLIKCKKDRSGHQCPLCSIPQKNKGKSLNEISSQDLSCAKPLIDNIYKLKNVTTPEEGSFTVISAKDFVAPIGSLVLNMTDQSGNEANLACTVQRPTKMSQITLERKEGYTIMRTTFSSFLVCSIDYDHIQKLWGILAMYSDSPMKLKRDLLLTKTPFISYKYKQVGSGDDVFTDIEADLRAEPNWLMQDLVTLQLDRSTTTLSMLHIQYLTDVYVTIPNSVHNSVKNSWVMIKKSNQTKTEYAAMIGGTVEMNCQVDGEPAPHIEWVLPDGSKIRAPYFSEEGRITITRDGKFTLKAADSFDTGAYHCIATNYVDADVLTFRITVVSADVEEEAVNGAELSIINGGMLYLPCGSNGVPDASVNWILPDHSILQETSGNKVIFPNGTLKIQDITERERGHFRCIAANQYGLDILTYKVFVKERKLVFFNKKIQLDQTEKEIDEGSGTDENKENNYLTTGKVITHRKFPTRRINTRPDGQGHLNKENFRRNRINQRFRGYRRQFAQNTRKIDPQRWTEILEKTKKSSSNSQTAVQVTEGSAKEENITEIVSGEPDEASGEEFLPVAEKFLIVSEKHTAQYSTTPASTDTQSYISSWVAEDISSTSKHAKISQDNLDTTTINREITVTSGDSTVPKYVSKITGSPQYIDTFTHTTVSYNNEQMTTLSILNSTSVAAMPAPELTTGIPHMSSSEVTTSPLSKYFPLTNVGNLEEERQDTTTAFYSLTGTPKIMITRPPTTVGVPYTTELETITASPIAYSDFHTTTQNNLLKPTIENNELQVTIHDDTSSFITTAGYLNNLSENVVTSPPPEISYVTTTSPDTVTNPATASYALPTHNAIRDETTTSSYLPRTFQSNLGTSKSIHKPSYLSISTTQSPLGANDIEVVTEPPIMHRSTVTNILTTPKHDISNFHLSVVTPNTKSNSAQQIITSTAKKDNSASKQGYEYSTNSEDTHSTQTTVPSTMIPLFHERKGELNKENVFSIDSSTKSSTKVFLSQTDIGPIYIHSTQKIISPSLSAGSTIISHQQIQIVKDVTPLVPTLRRYGRRRMPGRRRIVRPGRYPNIKIHQFWKFGKSSLRELSAATTPHTTVSDTSEQNQLPYSSETSSTYASSPTEQSAIRALETIHGKEATTQASSGLKHSDPIKVDIMSSNSVTQLILKDNTLGMLTPAGTNRAITHTQTITTDIPTRLPITTNKILLKTTSAQVTTRPRVTSKVIRRKIPWQRLFGNSQISQSEILKKLRNNIHVKSVNSTHSPTSDILLPKTSTALLSTQSVVSNSNISPSASLITTESNTALHPKILKATNSVINPEDDPGLVTPSTVHSTAINTDIINLFISHTKPISVFSTSSKTTTDSVPTIPTPLTTALYHSSAGSVPSEVDSTSPEIAATVASQAKLGGAKIVIATTSSSDAWSKTSSTSSFSDTTFKDVSFTPPKGNMFVTMTPVTSAFVDSTRLRFLQRKKQRKKRPYNILPEHNQWKSSTNSNKPSKSQEETTESFKITPPSDLSSGSVTVAHTTTMLQQHPLTSVNRYFLTSISKAPRLSLQQSSKLNDTDTLKTQHIDPSDNHFVATSVQALNKNNFKHTTVTTPKSKTPSPSHKDAAFPLSVTAKIISSLTDPSPILGPATTQLPVISGKKVATSNVEIRPDPKTSERKVHIVAHFPGVLKKTVQFNPSSTPAEETDKKVTLNKMEEGPSNIDYSKPRIKGGKAASFTVLANSDAFIPCEATGNPTPTILWTKVSSGTFMSKTRRGNRMEVYPNGTLSISSAGIQDRGQYLCVATNQYGSDRLLISLSVITYPPRILQGKSREITVHSGSSINLKCQAEGRPFPTITWILANETIASEKSAHNHKAFVQLDGTLIIKEVSIYDRGIYKCLATNIAGADTFTVKIQVIAAPPAILEDKRQTVLALSRENVKLHCSAKGNPQPSVHWVAFDGTKVKPLQYVNAKLFLFSNGTLYIRNAEPTDNGNYECIATSSTGSERRVVTLRVEQTETIPRIVHASPKSTEMNYGDKLVLNCTAAGEPAPRIIWRLPSKAVVDQWHRMGSRIQVHPNGSLVIQSVNEKDAGDYLCVARNKMGDDVILMKVSISKKPAKIIQKQQLMKEVPYGKEFRVDCKALGFPSPEISWTLPDGTVINNVLQADDSGRRVRRYVLFDNGTLYLNKVGMAEEGDYTCYAENTLGRDEMKIHITVVTAAPHIKINTRTKFEARASGRVVLDCEANGEPKPKIFWLLPSSDMIATSHDRYLLHENGSLMISHVKLLDAGEYMCVARNPAGDDTKLLKLDVHSTPPVINGLYTNRTIIKDSALKHSRKLIHCSAEGTPPLQIMWIMPDNIYLTAPYHGSRIIVHQNGTLEIRNVRPSDTAEFTCVARNDGGESTMVVQLEVTEVLRRPVFKNPFNEKIIVKPGKMAILNCLADGNPTPEIMWLLPNGSRFISGQMFSKYHAGTNGTLIIYSPSKNDAGKYRCAARNKVGYIEKLIILEVGQRPNILTHPRGPIKGILGETLSLHCLSDGIPKPSVIWTLPSGYVIDRPQFSGKHMLLENGTLVIQESNIHDRGNYLCKVKNNAGESSISVPVMIVAYPPRITSKAPQNIHTKSGSPVHLNCMAIGIPKPEITWELPDLSLLTTASKGRPMGTELLHPQGTLVVQNPRPVDSGVYKCIARNALGMDSSSTYLKVI
ncbi:PREDICTED: immunoglobulin superfamily member 10 [Nanorana parkeri]|uniref:immunoglobulin superfamily member 10 n=1 Tax=Nanorana parkeri TaxID=125878 RepID=UPI000854EE50|nr:PREDICTED: immunoglobulin superfamily member 10 [Nanorana parkeri]